MKAKANYYKGIEYILVSDLPADQQTLLEQKNLERFKILMEGKIISNCISYNAYSDWFHATFKQRPSVTKIHQQEATVKVHSMKLN
jgi:hypothetical protein